MTATPTQVSDLVLAAGKAAGLLEGLELIRPDLAGKINPIRIELSHDDTPSTADRREACAVIRDWLTEAESALVRGDLKKHFECLQEGLDVLTSLRGLEQ